MSAATSPGTGLAYGLQRVCAAWGFARSSFYAMKSRQQATAERPPAKRRGPKPAISDQALLVAIEADLEASPWEGEGYRKVWARLRVCRDIRVARKRVLRLMRENNLLSPHRCRRRGGNPHDGEIIIIPEPIDTNLFIAKHRNVCILYMTTKKRSKDNSRSDDRETCIR